MTDQSDPDFGDETTQTDASAPLVDFGNTPAEMTAETAVTDMSTMPETRSAAQRTLAREVEEERRRRVIRDGSAPLRRSTGVRTSAPEPIPPRRPEESRSLSSAPIDWGIRGEKIDPSDIVAITRTGDMKAGLTSSRPKLSLMPARAELHTVRPLEYGSDKYRRGNYHGAPPAIETRIATTPEEEALEREALAIMGYLDANLRHVREVTNAFQHAYGRGDLRGAISALAAVDDVASANFPPSGLPHLGHGSASLSIAIERAVDAGFLPVDPGQPWRQGRVTEERSPEAAARHEKPPCDGCNAFACDDPAVCERVAPEPLWHGYRRADVIAAARARWTTLRKIRIEADLLLYEKGSRILFPGQNEDNLREGQDLRRPDEPDYKPLA